MLVLFSHMFDDTCVVSECVCVCVCARARGTCVLVCLWCKCVVWSMRCFFANVRCVCVFVGVFVGVCERVGE